MPSVKFVRGANRVFVGFDSEPGEIAIAKDVDKSVSDTLSCSVVTYERCAFPYDLPHDEFLYCTSGMLTIEIGDDEYILNPDDCIWLPEGTSVLYRAADKATAVCIAYPIDWQERQSSNM